MKRSPYTSHDHPLDIFKNQGSLLSVQLSFKSGNAEPADAFLLFEKKYKDYFAPTFYLREARKINQYNKRKRF